MRRVHNERGQILPIVALLAVVLLGMVGLAVDVGRLYIAKAELSRAVDAAALAGVLELPDTAAAEARAAAYLDENIPDAKASFPGNETNTLRIQGSRSVTLAFMGILGIDSMDINATAAAGFDNVPMDVYLTLDATGSMHNGCNDGETNSGGACPIKEARDAAADLVDTLLGPSSNGYVAIGAGAFRGCYNPPLDSDRCIDASGSGSMITPLGTSAKSVSDGISNIHAIGATGQPSGGSGTNICGALKKGQEVIFGSGSHNETNTIRAIVILSDGDNVYNAERAYQASPQSPVSPCSPSDPSKSDDDVGTSCLDHTQTQEAKVDDLSYDMAETLKDQGVEIYVVAFSPCGNDDGKTPSSSFCSGIGNGADDAAADRRLLKCVASSTPDTNDHYFEVPTAADLPEVFQQIASALAFRLTE
jgi:hypothetical protein